MKISKRVEHKLNMGNYESVTLAAFVEADTDEFANVDLRAHIDAVLDTTLRADLLMAQQCTALDSNETYLHDWIERTGKEESVDGYSN